MHAARPSRSAALATVLALLTVAIVAFPRQAHGQVGGRVLNPNGVTPTASNVLVTLKGPDGESTRAVTAGRFSFPSVANGTRVTLQATAQGLTSAPVAATAPDTMVVLILRPARSGDKTDIVQQGGGQNRAPEAAPAAPAAAAPATPAAAEPPPAPAAAPTPAPAPAPAAAPAAPAAADTQAPSAAPQQATVRPAGNPAGNAAANAQGLAVQDAVLTTAELVNREPATPSNCATATCSTRYPTTVGTITFWTRLTGGSPGRWIEHVWIWEGEEIARVRQKVEASTWRTWTRKRIQTDWDGEWRVEVRAEDGTLLAERFFTIEAAPTP